LVQLTKHRNLNKVGDEREEPRGKSETRTPINREQVPKSEGNPKFKMQRASGVEVGCIQYRLIPANTD